jgi:hypothetical protein
MNINATLFAQMINFFIAYWVMRIFLFKPAFQEMQTEEEEQKQLNVVIKQQEQSIAIKEDNRQEYWQSCRNYFKENQPSCYPKKLISEEVREVMLPIIPQQLVDKLVDETEQFLIRKIGYIGE